MNTETHFERVAFTSSSIDESCVEEAGYDCYSNEYIANMSNGGGSSSSSSNSCNNHSDTDSAHDPCTAELNKHISVGLSSNR